MALIFTDSSSAHVNVRANLKYDISTIMKKTAFLWEYKVDINAIIANFLCEKVEWKNSSVDLHVR